MLQLKLKKRLLYGAIAFIWTVIPAYYLSLTFVNPDIVVGTCVPWGVYNSYAVKRAVSALLLMSYYLIPIALFAFFYCRIVCVLRQKVTIR